MEKNYYELLGVHKRADRQAIKKAYRKACLENHPDTGGDKIKFNRIKEAYSVLSDSALRSQYDKYGSIDPSFNTRVENSLNQYLCAALDTMMKMNPPDIKKAMLEIGASQIESMKEKTELYNSNIKLAKRLKKRITKSPDHGKLIELLDGRIEKETEGVYSNDAMIAAIKRVEDILNDYEFEEREVYETDDHIISALLGAISTM
jgi:curved DNA-binding protein CbpA